MTAYRCPYDFACEEGGALSCDQRQCPTRQAAAEAAYDEAVREMNETEPEGEDG